MNAIIFEVPACEIVGAYITNNAVDNIDFIQILQMFYNRAKTGSPTWTFNDSTLSREEAYRLVEYVDKSIFYINGEAYVPKVTQAYNMNNVVISNWNELVFKILKKMTNVTRNQIKDELKKYK